jgi:hypothetical protein
MSVGLEHAPGLLRALTRVPDPRTTQIYVHLGKQNSRKVMEFTSL